MTVYFGKENRFGNEMKCNFKQRHNKIGWQENV